MAYMLCSLGQKRYIAIIHAIYCPTHYSKNAMVSTPNMCMKFFGMLSVKAKHTCSVTCYIPLFLLCLK